MIIIKHTRKQEKTTPEVSAAKYYKQLINEEGASNTHTQDRCNKKSRL